MYNGMCGKLGRPALRGGEGDWEILNPFVSKGYGIRGTISKRSKAGDY